MKIRLLTVALITALVAPAASFAADDQTPLGEKMEKVGGAFRKLRKMDPETKKAQVADAAKNEDSLKQIAIIRENLTASLKLEPARKAEVPAAEQEKFIADYQAGIKKQLAALDKIEAAIKAGNNEEAARLAGVMNDEQKDAHKQFKKDKKKKA